MTKSFIRLYSKYLRIHLDKYLTVKNQINNVATKLNKANTILSKIRHYVDMKTLKSIYHAIFYLVLHQFGCKTH